MENKIEFTQIPNAYPYALANSGHVYNVNTKRRLKRQWIGNSWRTNIRRSDGTSFYFRHHDLESASRSCSSKATFDRETTRVLPDWPRYAVTPYGTVWCVNSGSRGRGAGGPFIVAEYYHRNKPHVNLSNKFGLRRRFAVKRLVEMAWGLDSSYAE